MNTIIRLAYFALIYGLLAYAARAGAEKTPKENDCGSCEVIFKL